MAAGVTFNGDPSSTARLEGAERNQDLELDQRRAPEGQPAAAAEQDKISVRNKIKAEQTLNGPIPHNISAYFNSHLTDQAQAQKICHGLSFGGASRSKPLPKN